MYVLAEKTRLLVNEAMQNKQETPVFSHKRDPRKIGRGNPLLARKRFKTIDTVDSALDTILNLR